MVSTNGDDPNKYEASKTLKAAKGPPNSDRLRAFVYPNGVGIAGEF